MGSLVLFTLSFGFLDSISNPRVIGFSDDTPIPGPRPVQPGVLLLGHPGDPVTRPTWAVDGSFLVIRYLFQKVPEFNEFLKANPILAPEVAEGGGSELLGARMMGRWKSGEDSLNSDAFVDGIDTSHIGAPIDLAPFKDDPVLAKDVNRYFHPPILCRASC